MKKRSQNTNTAVSLLLLATILSLFISLEFATDGVAHTLLQILEVILMVAVLALIALAASRSKSDKKSDKEEK